MNLTYLKIADGKRTMIEEATYAIRITRLLDSSVQ